MKNNLSKNTNIECAICTKELNNCLNYNSMNNSEVMAYVAYYYGGAYCYEWTHHCQNDRINKL